MKSLRIVSALMLTMLLGACGSNQATPKEETVKVVLKVTTKDKTDRQEVLVKKGESVLEVLEEHHDVEESNGFVTSIDGVSQDQKTNTYWLYEVNGEMADKGAKDLIVNEGDEIEFSLETFSE